MPPIATRELPKAVGRYEVVRQIGIGAMGRVLLARDPVLGRHVAIKVLRDDLAIAEDVHEALVVRMRHEAKAAARVTHPNLVVIHDMGEDEQLGLYLVFEYIEGPTLKQRLTEGRLSARQAARIGREIGAALSYAHEHGVLHRDVKPENIILSPTGTKLTDFGIARVPDSTLTHAGGLLGTPAYSAPETFREGKFSPESDQFSLAATLYEAIRGARAFPGDDAVSVAAKIANDAPEPFAESLRYPGELDEILLRGMAKDPAQRFESCKILGTSVMDALLSRSAPVPARIVDGEVAERTEESMTPAIRFSNLPDRFSDGLPLNRGGWRVFAMGLGALAVIGIGIRILMHSPSDSTSVATAATQTAAPTAPSAVDPATPPTGTATVRPTRRQVRTNVGSATTPQGSASASSPAPTASATPTATASTPPAAPSSSAPK